MSDRLTHDLPPILPDPWDWPAKKRKNGWWYLRFGSTERPLHRLAFQIKEGILPIIEHTRNLEHQCVDCGRTVTWGEDLQVDHASGDKDDCRMDNLQPMCPPCNRRKGREGRTGYTTT